MSSVHAALRFRGRGEWDVFAAVTFNRVRFGHVTVDVLTVEQRVEGQTSVSWGGGNFRMAVLSSYFE